MLNDFRRNAKYTLYTCSTCVHTYLRIYIYERGHNSHYKMSFLVAERLYVCAADIERLSC